MKLKNLALISVVATALILAQASFADDLNLSQSGLSLADGATDTHYAFSTTDGRSGESVVVGAAYLPSTWVANSTSKWVSIDEQGGNPVVPLNGVTTFTYNFSLTGFDASTAEIHGNWSSDNSAKMFLNGTEVAHIDALTNGVYSYNQMWSFSANSGFVAGENTLTYAVVNGDDNYPSTPGPTGVNVDIHGTAAPVPEPMSITALIGGVGVLLRRRAIR